MSAAIEEAIQFAQEAVRADEAGDINAAIEKYTRSVGLIQLGLQVKKEDETVDNSALQRYYKLYTSRIAVLKSHADTSTALLPDASTSAGSLFSFDDSEVAEAEAPRPPPVDEWRRVFWLMGILRTSMTRGGYLSSDKRIYVPSRVWLQKGARFAAYGSKLECAECLVNELRQVCTTDFEHSQKVSGALSGLVDMMDTMQNSLARQLPFIPEVVERKNDTSPHAHTASGTAVAKMKGIAKTLDRTVGRLGAMPSKIADPHEYIQTLVDVFDAAAFIETWIDHFAFDPLENAIVNQLLQRVAKFLYEVFCAFVIHDMHGLLERYMKKASASFVKAAPLGE